MDAELRDALRCLAVCKHTHSAARTRSMRTFRTSTWRQAALNGLVDRFGLKGEHIDEVVGGAVVTHSKDFNLAREARSSHHSLDALDARCHADPSLWHIPASRQLLSGQDRERRDRKCDLSRLRHDVRRTDRVHEEIFKTPRRAGPAERGARQAQGIQGTSRPPNWRRNRQALPSRALVLPWVNIAS